MSSPMNVKAKRQRSLLCSILPTVLLLFAGFFFGSAFLVTDYKQSFLRLEIVDDQTDQITTLNKCEAQRRSDGSESLPEGIVTRTSNLEMRPLWGPPKKRKNLKAPMSLLAMAVGQKQKTNVNEIVKKFPEDDFVVMLFHYDGVVDDWKDFEWSSRAIHVSAIHQTKWWFAKRFLHPDVVSEYAYIFLWDEDLGVANFHAGRYVSILQEEGLHISQPGLDPDKSEVHHRITEREKGSKVHRRIYKRSISGKICYFNSTDPPCTGWVEMMAPVFSRASWRCVWHLIQNDLIHAWGLDMQLGYCAQGNRTQNIGVVDSEYVVHQGLPTLGGSAETKTHTEPTSHAPQNANLQGNGTLAASAPVQPNIRDAVRSQSLVELEIFKNRWRNAVRKDECWVDPLQPVKHNS
ncbi:GTPase Der [Heracleum sosnowskyi]|uniref:GTPase Der n=1 Tax=Heracleum sosnowskyi TaxID=360622 RepID=A0AAD8LZ99_9APIA|nr:GTPase Der [Heracleum sosnowskyi]